MNYDFTCELIVYKLQECIHRYNVYMYYNIVK